MSTQRYLYWHPGEPTPEKTPKGAEAFDSEECEWHTESAASVSWCWPTRWPVTEAEWLAHHYCQAYGITVPEGWRVVDFGSPRDAHLLPDGCIGGGYSANYQVPILERIEEWITPTDEDAKRRPQVQVRNADGAWESAILLGVDDCIAPFVARPYRVNKTLFYEKCRMKKESKS
jgi:hypothetical protein